MTSRRQRSPESVTQLSERGGTGSTNTDVTELVNLLDKTDGLTDGSSDEEKVVTKTSDVITATNVQNGHFSMEDLLSK